MFDKQQNGKYNNKSPFAADKLFYNRQEDCYICPMGQQMHSIGSYTKKTATGFKQTLKRYQAKNCENCPMRAVCHKSKENRIIEVNENLNRLKQNAFEKLNSEEGIQR